MPLYRSTYTCSMDTRRPARRNVHPAQRTIGVPELLLASNVQYTHANYERNSKSGRFRRVFSSAAARRHFATSA